MNIRFKKINNSHINRSCSQHTKDSSTSIKNINNEMEDSINIKNKKIYKYNMHRQNSLFLHYNSNKLYSGKNNINNLSSSLINFNDSISLKKKIIKNNCFSSDNSIKKNSLKRNNDFSIYKSKSIIDIKKRNSLPIEFLLEKDSENKNLNKSNTKKSRKINYTLRELIKLDPYHLLNKGVKDDIKIYSKKNENFKFPNIGKKTKTINGDFLRVLNSNSLLIKNSINKTQLIKKLFKIKDETNSDLKYIIIWEGIYHLWQKHSAIINNLLVKFWEYKLFINKNEIITFEELNEFLIFIFEISSVKISFSCFLEDISYLFSEDKKKINLKKLYTIFMITNNNISYIDKIDYLCNVWENKDSGEINIKKLLYYLKNVFRKKSDYQKIYNFFTKSHKINYNLSKAKIKSLFINEQKIRYFFERNCQINYKIIDENYNEILSDTIKNNVNSFGTDILHFNHILCPKEIENFENLLKNYEKRKEIKNKLKNYLNN